MKIIRLICIFFLVCLNMAHSSETDHLKSFDNRIYNPTRSQVKGLSFQVRVSNLLEILNARFNWENLTDVYFLVQWKPERNFKIEVKGVPAGFIEIKNELISLISNRIDFVVPMPLISKFKGYKLSYLSKKDDILIKALDPSYQQIVSEMFLTFEKSGVLKRIRAQSPMGTMISDFEFNKEDWSNGNYVLDQYTVKAIKGIQTSQTRHKVSYLKVKNYYFPSQVEIKTSYEVVMPQTPGKESKNKQEVSSVITFSDYKLQ